MPTICSTLMKFINKRIKRLYELMLISLWLQLVCLFWSGKKSRLFLFSEAIRRDTPPVTNKYVLIHNIVVMKAIVGEANVPSNGIKIIVNVCV